MPKERSFSNDTTKTTASQNTLSPRTQIMRIVELNRSQKDHENKSITVTGVVRATYASPFPYFLIEDDSGTLICRPKGPLPSIKQHLKITGPFVLETPANCTVELAMLAETDREFIAHPTDTCDLAGCAYARQAAA
jgi:hypothetical protein